MKTITIFLLLFTTFCNAQKRYFYQSNDVNMRIDLSEDALGDLSIKITLTPLVNILTLNNQGCFVLDTIQSTQLRFRNEFCPQYIFTDVDEQFILLPRDTTVIYTWQISKNVSIEQFSFNVAYVNTMTKEYSDKEKRITRMPNEKGEMIYYIKQEDEKILLNKAHLEIID